MGKRVRDDEKPVTIAVCGFFTLSFFVAAIFSGSIAKANIGFYIGMVAIIALLSISWVFVLKNLFDPNYDKFRGAVIILAAIGLVLILAQRNGWLMEKEFQREVEQNKKENAFLLLPTLRAAFTGLRQKDCDHIYVTTVPLELKVEQPEWGSHNNLMPPWTKRPTGKKQGAQITCIKCYHVTHQVIDYGPGTIKTDSCLIITGDNYLGLDYPCPSFRLEIKEQKP